MNHAARIGRLVDALEPNGRGTARWNQLAEAAARLTPQQLAQVETEHGLSAPTPKGRDQQAMAILAGSGHREGVEATPTEDRTAGLRAMFKEGKTPDCMRSTGGSPLQQTN